MKPHVWFRRGNWHCAESSAAGATVVLWPRGVGDTPTQAWADYVKRKREWA
jgi:hypothetical protein